MKNINHTLYFIIVFFLLPTIICQSQNRRIFEYENEVVLTFEKIEPINAAHLNGDLEMVQSGNSRLTGFFRFGFPALEWKVYYPDGTIKSISNYSYGHLHGIQQNFFPNGNLSSQANYSDGFLEGDYYSYDIEGRSIYHLKFAYGMLIEILRTPTGHSIYLIDGEYYYGGGFFLFNNSNLIKRKINFKQLCEYDQLGQLYCLKIDELLDGFYRKEIPPEKIAEFLEKLAREGNKRGLRGDFMVSCGQDLISSDDLSASEMADLINNAPSGTSISTDVNPSNKSSYYSRLSEKIGSSCQSNLNKNVNKGLGGNSLERGGNLVGQKWQNQVDQAVEKMDHEIGACRDGNDLIAGWGYVFRELMKILVGIELGIEMNESHNSDKLTKVETKYNDDGEVTETVYLKDDIYTVVGSNGQRFSIFSSESGATIVVTTVKSQMRWIRQVSKVVNGQVTSKFYNGHWEIARPSNAVSDEDIKKKAAELEERKKKKKEEEEEKKEDDNSKNKTNPSIPISGGTCAEIQQAWERKKEYCEASNWQDYRCVDFVRRMNNCVGDIRVMMPVPGEDIALVGCSQGGDEQILKSAQCFWDGAVAIPINNEIECKSRDLVTEIKPFEGHFCTPETTPTPDQGCMPHKIVNPEIGGVPGGIRGSEINKDSFYELYLTEFSRNDENSKDFSVELSDKKNLINTTVVFFSENCPPSMNLINELTNNKPTTNEKIVYVNIDYNKYLKDKYDINYTPTIISFNKGKPANTFIGVPEHSELKNMFYPEAKVSKLYKATNKDF